MKNLKIVLPLLLVFISSFAVQAQKMSVKDGIKLTLEDYNIELKAGETQEKEIKVLASKFYKKAAFSLKIGSLPEGLKVNVISPISFESPAKIEISADKNISAGVYTVMIEGEGKDGAKVRTLALALKVLAGSSLSSID
ncbi:MAG: hypothetical protein KTR26_11620 [Flammeovirgaceae bacterium]|nr:hypothetical protein [Flammeovirgaceae bacterium]